jgi:ribonucleoside-diphosphate reductase alpha chain
VQPFLSGAISKTVNMPESATVEEVEGIYREGWKLGLKALAIYRDNCKVGQPLSAGKSAKADGEKAAPVEARPVRRRLPKKRPEPDRVVHRRRRRGLPHRGLLPRRRARRDLRQAGQAGLHAVRRDGRVLDVDLVGLQYGIPLEFYVSKFSNLRFEPAGMTDDPDLRIATSVLDYLFRRLALDHLPYEKRAQLGIFSAEERSAQVSDTYDVDVEGLRASVDVEQAPHTVGWAPPRPRSRSAAPPSCWSCASVRPLTPRCA